MPNLFPTDVDVFDNAAPADTGTAEVEYGRSWRFDFEVGEFVLTPTGQVAGSEGVAAWAEWCKKALMTPRYRYLIYSRDYGQEFDDLIGRNLSRSAIESEIKRIAKECLMVDPRTASVKNFVFTWQDDGVFFSCDVTNILGESANINSGSVVII